MLLGIDRRAYLVGGLRRVRRHPRKFGLEVDRSMFGLERSGPRVQDALEAVQNGATDSLDMSGDDCMVHFRKQGTHAYSLVDVDRC